MNETEKFEAELALRREEISIERKRQNLEATRMKYVGVGVPLILAIVAAVPVAINGFFQNRIDTARLAAEVPSAFSADRRLIREVIQNNTTEEAAAMLMGLEAGSVFRDMNDQEVFEVWLALEGGCFWREVGDISVSLVCQSDRLNSSSD